MSTDSDQNCSPFDVTYVQPMDLPPDATLRIDGVFDLSRIAEDCLETCPAFHSLSAESRAAVQEHLRHFVFAPNEPLITEGLPGKGLWIILSGTVAIQLKQSEQSTFINTVGPGEVIGEMSLLTSEPATATAIATNPTQAFLLPSDDFHRLVLQFPDLAVVLTRIIAARLGSQKIDVLAGKVLDQFKIHRRLAKGGMSVVYDAERTTDGQRAALKMMSHRLVYDRWALEMFQREADLIAHFQHPNIVQLLGRFQAFHTHFIAMEFCDGMDLRSLMETQGHLPLREIHRILGQLASAIAYSHSRGVVHRDLKPSNIMRKENGRVMLMDFGLAKPSVEESLQKSEIVGTPRYMAPEQLRGEPAREPADYFAFGCIAYELVLGTPLIPAGTLFELRELHHHWSVDRIVEECATRDPIVACWLAGCLRPRPEQRTLDLAAISEFATSTE